MLKALLLFLVTAAAEISGCYAVYAWLKLGRTAWWLVPGALSLALFAWLLTLHPPVGAGRTYGAYGGVYVAASLTWLCFVEGVQPYRWDVLGSLLCITGTLVIVLGPRWQ